MCMQLKSLDSADLYVEICQLACEQGVSTPADWAELCDEVLESHFDIGELNDDEDLESAREELHNMWEQYREESGQEMLEAIGGEPETM